MSAHAIVQVLIIPSANLIQARKRKRGVNGLPYASGLYEMLKPAASVYLLLPYLNYA